MPECSCGNRMFTYVNDNLQCYLCGEWWSDVKEMGANELKSEQVVPALLPLGPPETSVEYGINVHFQGDVSDFQRAQPSAGGMRPQNILHLLR